MNVVIIDRASKEPIVRYEIHLAGEHDRPAERRYFDDAWQGAVSDRLVDAARATGTTSSCSGRRISTSRRVSAA